MKASSSKAISKKKKVAVTVLLLLLFLLQKQTVKLSAQYHVLVQSPPDRRPNDKYPVNTSHRSDLCITFHCSVIW
jgi:hypothetical protein